jgi:hypothetical protein
MKGSEWEKFGLSLSLSLLSLSLTGEIEKKFFHLRGIFPLWYNFLTKITSLFILANEI